MEPDQPDQPTAVCAEHVDRSVTQDCSENITESANCKGIARNLYPSSPYRWAQSLLYLLEDATGVALFHQFLQQEGQDVRCLTFWFACKHVILCDPKGDSLFQLTNLRHQDSLKKLYVTSTRTRKKKMPSLGDDMNNIIDATLRNLETYMIQTTYSSFLKSDLYSQYLESWQDEYTAVKQVTASLEPADILPTHQENSKSVPKTENNLLNHSATLNKDEQNHSASIPHAANLEDEYVDIEDTAVAALPEEPKNETSTAKYVSNKVYSVEALRAKMDWMNRLHEEATESLRESRIVKEENKLRNTERHLERNKFVEHSAVLNKDKQQSHPVSIPIPQSRKRRWISDAPDVPVESLPEEHTLKRARMEFTDGIARVLRKYEESLRNHAKVTAKVLKYRRQALESIATYSNLPNIISRGSAKRKKIQETSVDFNIKKRKLARLGKKAFFKRYKCDKPSLHHSIVFPNKCRSLKEKFSLMDNVLNNLNKRGILINGKEEIASNKNRTNIKRRKLIRLGKKAFLKQYKCDKPSLHQSVVFPNKCRSLKEKFNLMDYVLNNLNKRSILINGKEKIASGKNRKMRFWKSHFGPFKTGYSDVFSVCYIKDTEEGKNGLYYRLIINPYISGSTGWKPYDTTPWLIYFKKAIYNPKLTKIVMNYHTVFYDHECTKLVKNPEIAKDEKQAAMFERQLKIVHILWHCFIAERNAPVSIDVAVDKIVQSFDYLTTPEEVKEHLQIISVKMPGWFCFTKNLNGIFIAISKKIKYKMIKKMKCSTLIQNFCLLCKNGRI